MSFLTLKDVDLKNKKVLVRVDFNVPVKDGKVTSKVRIEAAIPTIQYILDQGGAVILMSHLGRPTEGEYDSQFSLEPVAEVLSQIIKKPVRFAKDWLNGVDAKAGEIVMCDNVRFNKGEKKSDDELSKKIASLGDVFVMDAFATAHRAQASTYGVAKYVPVACAGLLLANEIKALEKALKAPKKPMAAIVGGSKVSTKLSVLHNLLDKVEILIVGGGIANTFIKAEGFNIGNSLYEEDLVGEAKDILAKAKELGVNIPVPVDVRVAKELSENAVAVVKNVADVADDEMILDIGPKSERNIAELLKSANTILWNGPVGVFEFDNFAEGTKALSLAIAESDAFSVAGGGDTIAAIEKFDIKDKVSYISTAGGAFLEFLEGKKLPAVEILKEKATI
ncbi:phosphoglycerate kinase [Francisella philomiragia]|uniref:Phosphoglycerate kinase n=1 Tax=Francisella philomiragia subsp. philomiragia (strain ATCC 25017 / CCUG 19701 / FSC 153 / O\|nr:phosphoglycerate kinase [Francisella philomiragia]B0TY21.1 RecName: Full=Phosphoglycerate kinase [Francisella philomiragia subsp. philomiragia ATCC 25017]AJI47961.1 phosphoglycerate kinase family protein [Francisella philomiragia]AJI49221.1 phosphoglycerate kinase family protein [Francisella philomiragia]MBK2020587.1 phosphoglycerate kinase [Francisella philomiragia]MBK2030357.1 phosphoglycerate kinase [Francisella philomiragia]MBK2263785.1 phosphoglycerate kinase [Francisella philomiragia